MDSFTPAQEDLDATMEQLRRLVEAVVLANSLPEKKKQEMAARPVLREARSKLAALRAEARRTADPEQRAGYESLCKIRDERIRNFDAEMKNQIYPSRNAAPKSYQETKEIEMMGAGGADGSGFTTSAQVLDAAVNVQNDALQSLARAEQLQNVTEETGKQTLTTLRQQTEQMYQIDEELRNLHGQIDRASRDLRFFYRQLAGDKCFLSIFGICVLALAVLVFVSIYTKRKKKAS